MTDVLADKVAVATDLTDVSEISPTFDRLATQLGRLDILVNSAGVQMTCPAEDVTEDVMLDANLKALFFCCQAADQMMLAQGSGKIVNLDSTFSVTGFPEFAAYCVSKDGVLQLTRALASEWAGSGVNVNAIGPTAVRTEMNAYLLDDPGSADAFLPKVPSGRILVPKDITGAAVHLAGPGSDAVHGHLLLVDGGFMDI